MPPVPQPVAKCLVVGFYDVDPTAPAAQVAFDAGFEHAIVVKVPSYYTRPDAAA
jgi:hypothetical protein